MYKKGGCYPFYEFYIESQFIPLPHVLGAICCFFTSRHAKAAAFITFHFDAEQKKMLLKGTNSIHITIDGRERNCRSRIQIA